MALSLQTIADQLGVVVEGSPIPIEHIQIDSRRHDPPESTLFFALPGVHHDGHDFVPDLYERGYRYFVVERPMALPGAVFLVVPSSLDSLQSVAKLHRDTCSARRIGITGSNGKTIVKEWLSFLLGHYHRVSKSPRSYNSQVGVPLSMWRMQTDDDWAILEAGISMPGEMDRLATMIQPEIGIFTSLGSAHGENFPSTRAKALEKLNLFNSARTLIYPAYQPELREAIRQWASGRNVELHSWAWDHLPDEALFRISVQRAENGPGSWLLTIQSDAASDTYPLPFGDNLSVENAVSSILGARAAGLAPAEIARYSVAFFTVDMRLQTLRGIQQSTLISDVYNNDERAFELTLDYLVQTAGDQPKTLILSDFIEGKHAGTNTYERLAQKLRALHIQRFIGVGPDICAHRSLFSPDAKLFPNVESLLPALASMDWKDYFVLVKGARNFQLERVIDYLQAQEHDTVYEIHLNAVTHNVQYFQSRIGSGVKILAMVKAFAYGVGMEQLALHLQYLNIDMLGVAFADEGVALRRAGVHLPILVMNPETSGHRILLENQLEPQLYSMASLRAFYEQALQMGENAYPVHLKLETGMHRLGFVGEELDLAVEFLKSQQVLQVASVFSHLAAAENAQHDAFTQLQLQRFRELSGRVRSVFGDGVARHLANSAGMIRFPEAQFEMVRLGLSMYGLSGVPEVERDLRSIGVFKTRVSQIKTVPIGESVGYGRSAQVDAPTRIAILPVGYADGISRDLGNGRAQFYSAGHALPTIGSICMDMTMVVLPTHSVEVGDEVILFESNEMLREWAQICGTIPYEILTRISQRVKRIYIQE